MAPPDYYITYNIGRIIAYRNAMQQRPRHALDDSRYYHTPANDIIARARKYQAIGHAIGHNITSPFYTFTNDTHRRVASSPLCRY